MSRTLKVKTAAPSDGCIFSTAVKPTRSPLVAEAKQLVKLARRNGYRLDELLELIESVA
jgi:hypothetical protein